MDGGSHCPPAQRSLPHPRTKMIRKDYSDRLTGWPCGLAQADFFFLVSRGIRVGDIPSVPTSPVTTTLATSPREGTSYITLRRTSRSEEHTSELQSLMRISYAVFCLNKTNNITTRNNT